MTSRNFALRAAGVAWGEAGAVVVRGMGLSPVVVREPWAVVCATSLCPGMVSKNQAMAPAACNAATSSAV